MDKETFYHKLIQALLRSGFVLRAGNVSKEDLSKDRDTVSSVIRTAALLAGPAVGEIHPIFDQTIVQQRLDKVHDWATIVALKYVLGQPVIVAVVEADQLTQEASIELAKRLDDVVITMLDATATLGGTEISGLKLSKGTRLSSMGIILNVFFDPMSASRFIERTRKRCKILHFFKKTWVLPWVVDVSNKTVSSHRGLPFLPGVINAGFLEKEIFQQADENSPASAA